ncbi:MAG TPA: valine--tRNA ligase [Granulicella sp.]|nr:valine--tRNA ligase [Granulicella sp.]
MKPDLESAPENALQAALPKAYDPSSIEQRWAEYWVREHLFDVATPHAGARAPDAHTQTPERKFTQLLPPPNVTGRLHIGHMLNQTEMDILTRWHRMSGDTTLWVPGTDHAGIATQMMVERQLTAEGTTRQALGREAFEDRVWQWKSLYGNAILDQMKRLGSTVDWSREYFTMDDRLSIAVKEAFVRLYEQGLIYRGSYIVNWCPGCQTAVSDLEVIHEDQLGKLYEIRYPLADGTGSIVIATTRPETMLGDVAVAVNPSDERYAGLIGKELALPLTGRKIPIIADDWANPEFGTGAVKVTPAHDPNDFAIGQRHNLPNLNIMDTTAHIDLPGSPYHSLDRYEARKRILADLEALGLLVAARDHHNAIGLCDRSKDVIEPRLSKQWFVKIQPLADKAIEAVDKGYIKFTPDQYRKTYDEWMKNIHDWCISRQLWWGHRIPAWHCADCAQITVSRETPSTCAHCASASITQETDVLDTWFSSGLLPFTVFGWPNSKDLSSFRESGVPGQLAGWGGAAGGPASALSIPPDLAAFYPTQLLVTGFDILFFWVARMIMLGCHFMLDVPMPDGSPRTLKNAVPFREVYIHALVRDAERQKMSKTKGNVIDPIDIISRFGTDAVRFTLASMASPGTDIAFSEARTEGNRAFANKIWNAARFLFMNIDRAHEAGLDVSVNESGKVSAMANAPLETRWILTRLSQTAAEVNRALAAYRFDEAASAVYQFFWGELCDWYLEIVKLRLNFTPEGGETANAEALASLHAFVQVFDAALRLLSPFMPFITEEIWHALYNNAPPAKSIALTRFPQAADFPTDEPAVREMETLQQLIVTVRALRKEIGVPEKEATPIRVFSTNAANCDAAALARTNADMLAKLCRVSAVEIAPSALTGESTRSTPSFDVEVVYARQIDVPAERERLTKDLAKYEKGLQAADRQLSNEAFMAKAPAHIVEGLRKQSTETRLLYDKTKAALEALPPA